MNTARRPVEGPVCRGGGRGSNIFGDALTEGGIGKGRREGGGGEGEEAGEEAGASSHVATGDVLSAEEHQPAPWLEDMVSVSVQVWL